MAFKKCCLLAFTALCAAKGFAQNTVMASELLHQEVRTILERDKLLLSPAIKMQERNEYWDNPKKREKVINDYEAFWDQIKNSFTPPQCAARPLHDSLVLDGESLQALGGRLFPLGNMRADFRGSLPEYAIPPGQGLGIPISELASDNSYFNFTSRQMLKFTSDNKLAITVGTRVKASVDAYLNGGSEKANQISYSCGTFRNHLGAVALSIRQSESFDAADMKLVRDFWEKSVRINQNDSLLVSFGGVCVYSSRSTDTYDQKKIDAALQGGFNAVILAANTSNTLAIDRSKRIQSYEEGFKILLYTRPFFTSPPTTAQIKQAWQNTVKSSVAEAQYSLQGKNTETIQLEVGPIDSAIYRNIKLDEDYTLQYLKYKGLLNKPRLELEPVPSNRVGMYKLRVNLSVDSRNAMEASADIIKGGSFDLPLRLYYNKIAGRDTLIVFESPEAAQVKYQNFPILENAVKFDLIPAPGDTANYHYKGEIPVRLDGDDHLLNTKDKSLIVKIRKVLSDTLALHPNLNTRLSWPKGMVNEAGTAYLISDLKLPKDYFMGRKDLMTMEVEMFISHSKNSEGSRRITQITLPLPE